ncbi:gamma-glutamyltranspeptidase [Penicillium chermesinum]|uniref:Gamma-glutamyltranspeptidase n=1 Tax=Penicillium chermesinum TaxID=63820 RepID=A0A9W9NNN3_9EURO|nr:gamma-glutamyltranspeptidase [Penicillium chermesinum]KAJ5223327.1 gamma-glutamyltranspeptidase [Penicillium chermesinum]
MGSAINPEGPTTSGFTSGRFIPFKSRRSVVHSTNGMVACTQPLAAEAGQKILRMGGQRSAAALNITEPSSTGIGGDAFCLFFDAKTKKVHALNGSGRSAKNSTLAQVHEQLGLDSSATGRIPFGSALSVTVPGAAAAWVDTYEKFGSGKLSLEDVLMPAIALGEEGFPVSELSSSFLSQQWQNGEQELRNASPNYREMLKEDPSAPDGVRAPRPGEIMRNPNLAKTFRALATEGKKGFYTGRIAEAIVDVLKRQHAFLELSDLEDHLHTGTEETEAISLKLDLKDVKAQDVNALTAVESCVELWEHPPNGQGIVALMALGMFEELARQGKIPKFSPNDHNSLPYLHAVIEVLKIAFADGMWWVTDPTFSKVSPSEMVSRPYLAARAELFDSALAKDHTYGTPGPSPAHNHSDTVYFCVTDRHGNGMSFINSNYEGFGSGIIPAGCGFTLQNRGANFQVGPPHHPNVYEPAKRPYHTIIPGLITNGKNGDERELHSVFGVMGGFMQPQGHLQVLLNMELFGMNPQEALDAPRICISANSSGEKAMFGPTISIEDGIEETVVQGLKALGHNVECLSEHDRKKFGRGQIIRRYVDPVTKTRVWSGGTDLRGDGCAMPAN